MLQKDIFGLRCNLIKMKVMKYSVKVAKEKIMKYLLNQVLQNACNNIFLNGLIKK